MLGCQCTGSDSSSAKGRVTTSAASNCTLLAVRTSQAFSQRVWYSVPIVMLAKASTASDTLLAVASPARNLWPTTSSSPSSPRHRPSHCRGVMRCPTPCPWRALTHKAVIMGCRPTINAAMPAPRPPFTAAQTPPR